MQGGLLGALFEIEQIKRQEPQAALLWGWNVDGPRPGISVDAHGMEVDGWLLGRKSDALAVEFRQGSQILSARLKSWPAGSLLPALRSPGQVPVGSKRPDVGAAFPQVNDAELSGFSATVSLSVNAPNEVEVWGILRSKERVHVATICGRFHWSASALPNYAVLASVVIPCFNQAHFLGEAIESVLAQTYPHVEVVVVDDGSTDNTAAVVERYPSVRYIRQSNQGVSEARNTGLRITNGDYLVFLDADDRLVRDALKTGVDYLTSNQEIAFVSGHYNLVAADGKLLGEPAVPCVENGHFEALLRGCYIHLPASAIFRRSLFEHVGGFSPSVGPCADHDLYLRVARAFPIACHHSVVADYRFHSASMSRKPDEMLRAAARVLESQREYSKRRPELRNAIKSGRRSLRNEYSGLVLADIFNSISGNHWWRAVKDFGTLTRHDPGALKLIPPRVSRRTGASSAADPRREVPSEPVRRGPLVAATVPRVTVVIPFFNAEDYLAETIQSVLNQTFSGWELILVDDGSADSGRAIADGYAKKCPAKITVVQHEGRANRGVCASRNLAISMARGEYIAPLDADDVWLPQKLEEQVEILDANPSAGLVYGHSRYWQSWSSTADEKGDYTPSHGVQTDRLYPPKTLNLLLYPLATFTPPCPSDLLLRKDLVLRVGGFEEEFVQDLQLYEDQAFLSKVYLHTSVFVSSNPWDLYRLHPASCDARVVGSGQYHKVRHYFLEWFESYLRLEGLGDRAIRRALSDALFPYRHPRLHHFTNTRNAFTRLSVQQLVFLIDRFRTLRRVIRDPEPSQADSSQLEAVRRDTN